MTSLGGYEIGRQIGAGASGTVWEAFRRGPGPVTQVVAVKRLRGAAADPDEADQLRREAMVLTELDHPHIVRVLEVLADGDGVAICMQHAPGGSLEDLLTRRGRLTPGEVVAVAVPVAEALASAHRRGILHVDVKPANILFTSDGEPLLGDFGVARTLGRLTAVLGGGGHRPVAGTAHYLAPELLDGAPPDARSDVYSLAVVCYEALTGKRPYDAALPLAVLRAADAGRHESLAARPDVPGSLAAVIEQAMARDPDHRIATADLLARALRAALPLADVHLPGVPPPPPALAPPPPPPLPPDPAAPPPSPRFPADPADPADPAAPPAPAPAPWASSILPAASAPPEVTIAPRADGPEASAAPVSPTDRELAAEATTAGDAGPPRGADAIPGPPPPPDPPAVTDRDGGRGSGGEHPADRTRTFGPRPPQRDPGDRRRRPWLPATLVAAAAAPVLLYLALGPLGQDGDDDCPDLRRPFPEAGTQIVVGDPEGDGCATYGVYQIRAPAQDRQDMFLTIHVDGDRQQIRLGELGDRLFLGDWDCDGDDTPGLYRRRRGEVQYFDTWPGPRDEPYEPDRTDDVARRSRASLVEQDADEDGTPAESTASGEADADGGDRRGRDDEGAGQRDNGGGDDRRPQRRCDLIAVEPADDAEDAGDAGG